MDLALVGLVFAAVMAWQTRHLPTGAPAPDFTLRTLSGGQVRLSELQGKPVVLAFWAPWCGVCKFESSTLSALRSTVGGSAHVLSVAVAYEDEEDVRRFAREHAVDYPVLLGGPELMRAYGVEQFPTTFFVSSEGHIERAAVGYTTRLGLLWRMWL
ncbi:TlpA disulfide reductase family protein [Archangium sp.]|uniref:TlpA family protein disulfide reductase n=1 Tax=Archangium sp. TaxID=1872627 RepID=UPI002D39A332|nr:TlpA disulfide reductase family protein [Archangium sp.]HYO56551.1 TlpA disulfide reductase family protein [Archangium sp.]